MSNKPEITGFTLIELLVVISIIILLMALVAGPLNSMRDKTKKLQTAHTMEIIEQALLIYKNAVGSYPSVRMQAEQVKLYEALSMKEIKLYDYNGVNVIQVIKNPVSLNLDHMAEDKLIKKDSLGKDCFCDAWGNPILYFYGQLGYRFLPTPAFYPYAQTYIPTTNPGSNYRYNRSWGGEKFDLISFGPDGKSTRGTKDQKDDITNFK